MVDPGNDGKCQGNMCAGNVPERGPGNAGRISSYLREALSGRSAGAVHSCFNSSFNFTLSGRLVHAGPDFRPLCCFGMELPGDQARDMLRAIAPGDLVTCRDGRIVVYGRTEIFTLHADRMETVDLRIENDMPHNETPHEDAALWGLLRELDLDGRLGIEMDGRFQECCRALEAFARWAGGRSGIPCKTGGRSGIPCKTGAGSAIPWNTAPASQPSLPEAITWLIGRGQGLTPSGDDILLGYGAGLLALDPSGAGRRFLDMLSGCLHGQTTDISLGYYEGLMAGCANENMKFLLRGFWSNDRGDTARWLESVRAVGHTSGCDTLFGLRLASTIKMKDGEVNV